MLAGIGTKQLSVVDQEILRGVSASQKCQPNLN